jgi:tRNA A-37 threonylcarbamoyl transferase component Bud32
VHFNELWTLKLPWFEPPNSRRGGWSGVAQHTLRTNEGMTNVFIKRQDNHFTRTVEHPFKGMATFHKEYKNILRMQRYDLPTLDVVYFGQQDKKAILITKALDGYISLDEIDETTISQQEKYHLLETLALNIRKMHTHHLRHSALYPKHLFIKQTEQGWDIRFIDLENLRSTLTIKQAMMRDLATLDRHAKTLWTVRDRLVFLHAYFGVNKLPKHAKKLWQHLRSKDAHKRRYQ